jgi:hypothetical protein
VGVLRTREGGSGRVGPSLSERERGKESRSAGRGRPTQEGKKRGQGRKKKRMGPTGEQCHFSFIQYFSN